MSTAFNPDDWGTSSYSAGSGAFFETHAPKGRSGTSFGVSRTTSTGGLSGGVSDFSLQEAVTSVRLKAMKKYND
jgi:hypothetical protein